MEIQINNDFLLTFASKYQDNAAKAIKYLAVLGIHFLETANKQDMPFKELQELAKKFSQPKQEPEPLFNKELQVIKDELAQLNKKIDNRYTSPAKPTQPEIIEKAPPLPKANEGKQQTAAAPHRFAKPQTKFDGSQKPPTAWREEKKPVVRNTEPSENTETRNGRDSRTHSRASPANRSVERREGSVGRSKGDYDITPKPTEIVLPAVDLKESKNRVTRHHLDDSEAKKLLCEEGVIFFPQGQNQAKTQKELKAQREARAQKEEVPKTVTKEPRHEPRQEQFLGESPFFGRERPTQPPEDSFNAEWSDVADSSLKPSHFSKSPRFPQTRESRETREIIATQLFPMPTIYEDKENERSLINQQERRRSRDEPKTQPKWEFSKNNQARHSLADSSRMTSSKTRKEYGHVSSKIKDEVNYHKELSKQYKKMKQSMGPSEASSDDFILSSSTRFDPVRENVQQERHRNLDMDTAAWGRGQYQEDIVQAKAPKLMESTDSTIRSSLTMQQLAAVNPDNRRPVENTRPQNRFEDLDRTDRTDEENMYRSRTDNNRGGGMLDIANSFLNSPLMQHITNNDKNYDTSFKDSMAYSIQNRNPRFTNYASGPDLGESSAFMQSRSGNFGTEEDMRLQSSYGLQQSKYSNAGNTNAYASNPVRRVSPNLKDSTNRRFQENMNNELAASYNREGVSSLASSNFSNFLNDEMKGFYQKERLDLKKPKNSDLIMKFGSSVTSENTSFQGNEPPHSFLKGEKKSQFYKNEYGDNLDNTNNKTFDGFSFDNANVFKDERMSVTQILNN